MKPELPIDTIDIEEFNRTIKNLHLDEVVLNEETLSILKGLFAVGDPSMYRVDCDEHHGHTYPCVTFHHPATAVVDRLMTELERYKEAIDQIKKVQTY